MSFKALLMSLALAPVAFASAHAQNLSMPKPDPAVKAEANIKRVWGADENGSYSKVIVPHVIKVLEEKAQLPGYVWSGKSDGTLQNAEMVTLFPTNLALVQWDIASQLVGQPIPKLEGKVYKFTFLQEKIMPECLFAATKSKAYTTFGHIRANAFDIDLYTGPAKSGSYGTWRIIRSAYPELGKIKVKQVVKGGAIDILSKLKNKSDVAFFVTPPDPNAPFVKYMKDNGISLIPVVDEGLENVYDKLEFPIGHAGLFSGAKHVTSCTHVALITGDKELVDKDDERAQERMDRVVGRLKAMEAKEFRPVRDDWRSIFDGVRTATAEKVSELTAASRRGLAEKMNK